MAGGDNPLKVHAILLIVIGVMIAALGIVQLVRSSRGGGSIMGNLRQGAMMQNQAKSMGGRAGSIGKAPTSLQGGLGKVTQVQSMGRQAGRMLRLIGKIWLILVGVGTGAMGVFILKEKNWARIVGFGGLGFGVLYVAGYQGTLGAVGSLNIWLGLVIVLVVAGICSKLLWDLMTEEFA